MYKYKYKKMSPSRGQDKPYSWPKMRFNCDLLFYTLYRFHCAVVKYDVLTVEQKSLLPHSLMKVLRHDRICYTIYFSKFYSNNYKLTITSQINLEMRKISSFQAPCQYWQFSQFIIAMISNVCRKQWFSIFSWSLSIKKIKCFKYKFISFYNEQFRILILSWRLILKVSEGNISKMFLELRTKNILLSIHCFISTA